MDFLFGSILPFSRKPETNYGGRGCGFIKLLTGICCNSSSWIAPPGCPKFGAA
jgi:hypothetical protein